MSNVAQAQAFSFIKMQATVDGRKIKQLRESQEMEQARLAEKTGLNQGTLSKIESTGRTSPKTARLIAHALGVPLDEIKIHPVEAVQLTESVRVRVTPPEGDAQDLPSSFLDFVRSLSQDEQRELLDIAPMILRIYRAQTSGDEVAKRAWGWIRGNLRIFDRALRVE